MVVVPRHRGRFMADDALHNVKWHTGIGRKRNEGVPEGMKGCLRRSVFASFYPDRRDYVRRLEDTGKFLTDKIASAMIHFTDCW